MPVERVLPSVRASKRIEPLAPIHINPLTLTPSKYVLEVNQSNGFSKSQVLPSTPSITLSLSSSSLITKGRKISVNIWVY